MVSTLHLEWTCKETDAILYARDKNTTSHVTCILMWSVYGMTAHIHAAHTFTIRLYSIQYTPSSSSLSSPVMDNYLRQRKKCCSRCSPSHFNLPQCLSRTFNSFLFACTPSATGFFCCCGFLACRSSALCSTLAVRVHFNFKVPDSAARDFVLFTPAPFLCPPNVRSTSTLKCNCNLISFA